MVRCHVWFRGGAYLGIRDLIFPSTWRGIGYKVREIDDDQSEDDTYENLPA